MCWCLFFFFKQKTAYEMRISDWSSDVCSSDLSGRTEAAHAGDGGTSRQHRGAGNGTGGTDGRAGAKLRRAGDEAGGDARTADAATDQRERERKSVVEGKSVSVRVDIGGRRLIKKKKDITHNTRIYTYTK